eukprot:gene9122-9882_t
MPYSLIPLKNNKYKVVNKITGKVFAKSTTKEKAEKQIKFLHWIDQLNSENQDIHYSIHGKGLQANDLYHFLHNSYQKKKDNEINGYTIDPELSGNRVQVYFNEDKNHAVVAHRGTQGMQDWVTNLRVALGDKSGKRFQHSKDIQKKAEEKYKNSNITTVGHSQGALHAEHATKGDVITLNKPTTLHDIGKKPKTTQHDIKTTLDPVSILKPLERKNGNEIVIPSKTYNPLIEHSTETLKRLHPDVQIGS